MIDRLYHHFIGMKIFNCKIIFILYQFPSDRYIYFQYNFTEMSSPHVTDSNYQNGAFGFRKLLLFICIKSVIVANRVASKRLTHSRFKRYLPPKSHGFQHNESVFFSSKKKRHYTCL